MPEITVYGQPGCQGCRMTTRHLDRLGVAYRYADITADDADRTTVAMLGYQSVPVVVAGDVHWHGYRPDALNRLAAANTTTPDLAPLEVAAEQYLAGAEVDGDA